MFPGRHIHLLAAIAMLLAAFSFGEARAQSIANFYKNKQLSIVIGSGPGGGYDLSSRLIAKYLGKYIPGNPNVIPRNMPGASSQVAAQYVYNVAERDGTVIGMFQPTFATDKMLNPSLKFEADKFAWIGRVTSSALFGVVRTDRVAPTIDAVRAKEVTLAGSAANGTAATVPWALNRLIGTKFKVVLGYESSSAMGLAMERGEVDGNGSTSWEYLQSKQDLIKKGEIGFLYATSLERASYLPEVPTIVELATNDHDRRILRLIAATSYIGRAVVAPPNTPVDRVDALRVAFQRTVRDPDFIADATKAGMEVEPLPHDQLEKVVLEIAHAPQDLINTYLAVTAQP